jgi:Mg-chelatase subunit ChlD
VLIEKIEIRNRKIMNQKLNEDWMDMSQIDLDAIKLECTIVDADWLQKLFPEKEKNKLKQWLSVLKSEEFDKIDDLAMLDASGWELLSLPLGVKIKIKSFVDEWKVRHATVTEKTSADLILDHNEQTEQPISQIDCILIDISSSMRARSNIDADKTREDVSKMLFHTMVDKLICLELSHAVGLVAFGASILPIAITRQYESFHDQLGRLDANQNSTRLYDAIYDAADLIEEFTKTNKTSILKTLDFENEKADTNSTELLQKRIFVLTDGEDNASQKKPWQVAKHLQEKSIILDAIPLAGSKNILQSICAATSGLCFDIVDQEQGINLFEREATLHVAYREVETTTTTIEDGTQIIEKKKVIKIIDENSLKSLDQNEITCVGDAERCTEKSFLRLHDV